MTSLTIFPFLSLLAPFGACEYPWLHAPRLNVQRFQSMLPGGERNWIYSNRYDVDRLSAVSGWVKRRMHRVVRRILIRCDKTTYVDIPFIRCTEEE